MRIPNEAIAEEEARYSPKTPDASKAAEPDEIHQVVARQLAEVLVRRFSQLFIASLNERRILSDWLTSTVIVIHDDEDRDIRVSYRPKILSPIALTTVEISIRNSTGNHLEAEKLTMLKQHYF